MLGGFVRAEIKQLFVIHQARLHMIKKPDSPDNVDWELFRLSEVNSGIPFQVANSQRHFVAKRRE